MSKYIKSVNATKRRRSRPKQSYAVVRENPETVADRYGKTDSFSIHHVFQRSQTELVFAWSPFAGRKRSQRQRRKHARQGR